MNPDGKVLCCNTNLHEFDDIAGLPAQQVGHEGHNLTRHKPAEKDTDYYMALCILCIMISIE